MSGEFTPAEADYNPESPPNGSIQWPGNPGPNSPSRIQYRAKSGSFEFSKSTSLSVGQKVRVGGVVIYVPCPTTTLTIHSYSLAAIGGGPFRRAALTALPFCVYLLLGWRLIAASLR